jgi:hypothetical protein
VNLCPEEDLAVGLELTDADGCAAEGRAFLEVADVVTTVEIQGPDQVCEGECVELAASPGYSDYAWEHGDAGERVTVCPTATTTYRVTATEPAYGCQGQAEQDVATYPPPRVGSAVAADDDPCTAAIRVRWQEAAWRPGSAGGVYNLYRREGSCVNADDPSWELLVTGLTGLEHLDETVEEGTAYTYLVEAEDEAAPFPCRPGPHMGGPSEAACADPEQLVDDGDPLRDVLVGLSPWLRATGWWRSFAPLEVHAGFTWEQAPGVDPRTHFQVWRSDVPWDLRMHEPGVAAREWTDPGAEGARLYFYKVYNVTECGNRID